MTPSLNLSTSFDKLKTLSSYIVMFDDRTAVIVNTYDTTIAEEKAKLWAQREGVSWVKMVSCEVKEVI